MLTKVDYIIIGGGTAGCVLASRLSALSRNQVVLVEAGPDTPPSGTPRDILDPYPLSYTNPAYHWPLVGHALSAVTSPAKPLLHARVMGGGSSIMGMIMLRGLPVDYDGWASSGAAGWDWNGVLPYFRRLETDSDFHSELHGTEGPTRIRRHRPERWPPIAKAAGDFARRTGLPLIEDMNGDFRDGYGILPIAGTAAQRDTSASAYLTRDVRARPNLHILANATAEALQFMEGRVSGARIRAGGASVEISAKEVILTMGALLSPHFLLRNGIGDGEQLHKLGMTVRKHLPGVGKNLQNHAALIIAAHLKPGAVQKTPERNHNNTIVRYSSGVFACGASDMALGLGTRASWHAVAERIAHFTPILMAPKSRGEVSLSDDLTPRVEYRLLDDGLDAARLADGFRRAAALVGSPEMSPLIGRPVAMSRSANMSRFALRTPLNALSARAVAMMMDRIPGLGDRMLGGLGASDTPLAALASDPEHLADYIRGNVGPLAHHAGTCRMGRAGDLQAVVDKSGKVYGIDGLRVADASIMPAIPRANTNLPTLMIAEKIADMML